MPAVRYVDDLFGIIFKRDLDKFRVMLLELITELGFTLEDDKTPIPQEKQVILGIEVEIKTSTSHGDRRAHVHAKIDPQKAEFWTKQIKEILQQNKITARDAEKLAGRLNFAASSIAGQSGSARINELYKVAFGRTTGKPINHRMKDDLHWWLRFLMSGQCLKFRILVPKKKR